MKTFSLFLLTIMVVTAAPATSRTTDNFLLKEIIDVVKHLDKTLNNKMKKLHNFCKAGEVLEKLKAEDLGLQEKQWLLPRKLVAYTRNIQCKKSASDDEVQLPKLLTNIQRCAQMIYGKP
ncbi:hypothetical protein MHYP_G00175140 [Metynnis hypsauchen]